MRRIKLVLAAATVMVAMLAVTAGSASAQEFDDCEFAGFDGDEAIFVCEVDVDFDGISDDFDDFVDADFDGFDDRFFSSDDGFDGGVSQSIGQESDSGESDISFGVS